MKKILILDDEPALLDLWKDHFRLWKLDVEICTGKSGVDGLRLLQEEKEFDLIISDYIMPNMDGLEFIRQVRKTDKKTPVCFFTGYLPELTLLAEDMEKVLLFEKPIITQKMKMYINICLNIQSANPV